MPSLIHGNLQTSSSVCRGSTHAVCTSYSSKGTCYFSFTKMLWISVWKVVPKTQNPYLPGSSHNPDKKGMLLRPRASFSFDSPGSQLSEFGQSMVRAFETEAAEASKFLPGSSPEELHSGTLLHHLSAIPTEFFVSVVALLVGTSIGLLSSKSAQTEHTGDLEPFAERLLRMKCTPFNRFVLMRCPSLEFKDLDVYEGLPEKFTAEGHHVIRIANNESHCIRHKAKTNDSDNSPFKADDGVTYLWLQNAFNKQNSFQRHIGVDTNKDKYFIVYQRTFLNAKDGGVLAIDWPSHLELSGKHGLDTTFLLVPGSLDGSKGTGIQDFVQRCVKHGYFPLVLNPRGCGGSPLTTPRLFTAGDSDDVRMAVEFVLKSRPSSSMMAIGWGYGADMLVKYLGEDATSTPVTAAVCIENIFDLEEATKVWKDDHANKFNLTMTNNYIEILKSNQMLFEGKGKCFNVQKGLSAKTVREFDEAISMVSRGYDNVQDLYKDYSSKYWINKIKIPILCVQGNASVGKTFSIRRHDFEENPFTTLILQLDKKEEGISQTNVSVHSAMMIEWLAAVELAFLKGRHPLLDDIEVTFKPQLRERMPAELSSRSNDSAELMAKKASESMLIRSHENSADVSSRDNQRSGDLSPFYRGQNTHQSTIPNDTNALIRTADYNTESDRADSQSGDLNGAEKETQECIATESSDDDNTEAEQGQVRLAAESVMKALDVTMPGTLSDKQKEEVLEAVGRGETLVSALQEACPEDVREKLVTAVSASVQARGISLKLAGFGKNMPAPKLPAGMVEKVQQKLSSLMHNKVPVAPMHAKKEITKPDLAASGNSPPFGNGDQPNGSGQNEGAQKGDIESLKTKQVESSNAVSPGDQTENGAATEIPAKSSSEVEQASRNISPQKEVHGDVSLRTDKEAGSSEEKPFSHENNTKESDSMHTEKQSNSIPQEQPKTHELDQKQKASIESQGNEPKTENNIDLKASSVDTGKQSDSNPQELPKTHELDQKQEASIESQVNEPTTEKNIDLEASSSSMDPNQNVPGQNAQDGSSAQTSSSASSASPLSSLNLGLAMQALTGVDDATQMAVTNVFGVMENVLEQLEKERGKKDEQLQQSLKDELPETGQVPEQLDKGQKYERHKPSSSSSSSSSPPPPPPPPESLAAGTDMDNRKHSSSLLKPLTGNNSGQLGLHEGSSIPECCPDKGYDELQKDSIKSQNVAATDFDNQIDGEPFSGLSSGSSSPEKEGKYGDTDLALEYFEDENIWKLDTTSSDMNRFPGQEIDEVMLQNVPVMDSKTHTVMSAEDYLAVNPEHLILDAEPKHYKHEEVSTVESVQLDDNDEQFECSSGSASSTIQPFRYPRIVPSLQTKIETVLMNALELEIVRRLGKSDTKLLGDRLNRDIELVSLTVAETVVKALEDCHLDHVDKEVPQSLSINNVDKVHVDVIVCALNKTYEDLADMPALLPAGVLLGSILAALGPLGIIASHDVQDTENFERTHPEDSIVMNSLSLDLKMGNSKFLKKHRDEGAVTFGRKSANKLQDNFDYDKASYKEKEMDSSSKVKRLGGSQPGDREHASAEKTPSTNSMMGAMAAAVGATSALASQENAYDQLVNDGPGSNVLDDGIARSFSEHADDLLDKDEKSTMVSTLAEKAMSVAAPMVPTKQDGGVDHERLVGLLAGLGQKGGILMFVGKAALLWGGLRGAMSLTERLLGFLHISDRPLYQRISGFMVMVLLIWSPVVVPLIPALLQQWASGSRSNISSTGALIGLYFAVVILVTIWGKKIRGYDDPLYHYGLKTQPKSKAEQLRFLLSGLVLGLSLLASVYLLGSSFHFVQLNLAPGLQFNGASKTILWSVLHSWRIIKMIVQCIGISLAVSFVEELFFRSWLQHEISADLGFHKAAFLSGFAFAITHRSLSLIPGLWLLSYILTGVKFRCNGDFNLAIGIRAGLMAGTQLITMFGQVDFDPHASMWFIGHGSSDPFSGLIGIALLAVLALIIYPWRLLEKEQRSPA